MVVSEDTELTSQMQQTYKKISSEKYLKAIYSRR